MSFCRSELSLALLLRSDCEWARSVVPNKLGLGRAGVFRLGAVVGLDFQLRMLVVVRDKDLDEHNRQGFYNC
jgi:hypothetical protein